MDDKIKNEKQFRAQVLIEALPYIQDYNGKVVVIKYGGNAMINEELKMSVMRDIVLLRLIGVKVVLVHGGGPEISEMLKKIGKQSVFIDGLRYTDEETAEVVRMVLAGKINKSLVNLLESIGGKALGLCGIDGHMMKCCKENEKLGYVGKITEMDTKVLTAALNAGYIPVVSTVGYDDEGHIYNVNADTASAVIAGALGSDALERAFDLRFVVTGPAEPERAQVTRGGLLTERFDPATLEARELPGLFACGEALNVDGACGGFNLAWAWKSGLVAGRAAAGRRAADDGAGRA